MIAETLAFLVRINLALAGAVLLVLALRVPARLWFGARVAYLLWCIVPVVTVASLLPARTIEIVVEAAAPHAIASAPAVASDAHAAPLQAMAFTDLSSVLLVIWLAGVVAMLAVQTLRQRVFVASLGQLRCDAHGTLRASGTCAGPVILGALRPQLVLPHDFETQFEPAERHLVLAHERVHLKRNDPFFNGLAVLTRCACWFNPLAHAAAFAMRIDQELACDAAVAECYPRERRAYAAAMLKSQLTPLHLPMGCAWAARSAHPLKLRFAMLKRDPPHPRRVAAGSMLAALVSLTMGCATWGSQPPREVTKNVDSALDAQLLRAVLYGNVRRAEDALRKGADANVRSRRGLTVLTIAARAEDMRMLNLLLDHGADVHLTSPGEGNALIAAGGRGHIHAVAALIDRGATVNEVVPGQGTPLAASVRTGHFDVVRYLVEHGADVNLASPPRAPWDRWGTTRKPLDIAIGGNHVSTADYLRSMGATM